ncbi:hypothetical protein JL720_2954 [Aureococcus anophagefferens]|nr:hypothetical protein JL720_2954 [Aureococcus anophagefferens]
MDRSLFHSPKTLLDRLRNRSPPTVDDPAHAHHLVYACGYNATGQLGCGDRESRVVPWRVRTSRLGKGRVGGVACGTANSCGASRGLRACGSSPSPRAHTLALDDRGRVYSWGRGDEGQLGHGAFEAVPHPRRIARLPTSVVAVGAGRTHSLALDADGAVYSWGCGDDGALGHGDRRRQLAPRAVEFFKTRPAAAVSCGSRHNAVVTADGALVTWAGRPTASAARPPAATACGPRRSRCPATARSASWRRAATATLCATRHASGDAIWAFGWNAYGQCGGSTCSAAAPRRVGGKFLGSPDGNNGAVVEALSAAVPNSNLQVDFSKRTVAVSGLSPAFVSGTLLPGCAVATAVGNVFFALMALAVGPNATAQPQGVSAVLLAVILSQVVAPEKASRGDAVSSYEAALFVASLVGFLELLMAPFVAQLKASVPSAALHASVAGQALVGLTMGFAGDFAAPRTRSGRWSCASAATAPRR